MYIVVVGLGQVGLSVVRILEARGHEVVAIDRDPHSRGQAQVDEGATGRSGARRDLDLEDFHSALRQLEDLNSTMGAGNSRQFARGEHPRVEDCIHPE
jgi:6-phosphogluconate dehydrogenase (decarboxylating)